MTPEVRRAAGILRAGGAATSVEGFVVEGVKTTIPFHREALGHPDFREARITTRWVEGDFLRGQARVVEART